MSTRDLLIEIGTEELPPKALSKLSAAFTKGVEAALKEAELNFKGLKSYASPRRMALVISDLDEQQADKDIEKRGPALAAAYDEEGCPTKAAQGFARSCGVAVEDLKKLETDKGVWLVFRSQQPGQPTSDLIPDIVKTALDKLPIPKRMRWGDLDAQFVRPVQWAVLLFGDEVIKSEILSVKTGRESYGHRFHHPQAIKIPSPAEYEVLLESDGRVIANFDRRKETVRAQIEKTALENKGKAIIDESLLEEVTSMVEWPVAVLGNFDKRFLDVPQEALISTMKTNQKYFHLVDKNDKLLPCFITISNIESSNINSVREGNERVIRPRFADAEFFWDQDRKRRLDSRIDSLKSVVFQKQLGTLFDKTQRITKLAGFIANKLGGDKQLAMRAAELSKCDLMTEMVGEFPSLQGIMGRYYASHDGEDALVVQAQDDYYLPRFAGDKLPDSIISQSVALADRLDTLLGIFAIGQTPTGDKDPYALRRAALGVLRILIEQKINLDLKELLQQTAKHYTADLKAKDAINPVLDFILDRLRAYYKDQTIRADVLEAVTSNKPTRPIDIDKRLHAVNAFRSLPAAESLAAANKRIGNILKKVEGKLPEKVNNKLFCEDAEGTLYTSLSSLSKTVQPLIKQGDYTTTLQKLAELREPVDEYFDSVMVMDDDKAIRDNRIAVLNNLHKLFLQVADISRLQN